MTLSSIAKSLVAKFRPSSNNLSFEEDLNLLNELVVGFSLGECPAKKLVKQIDKFDLSEGNLEDFFIWFNHCLAAAVESSVPVLAVMTGKPVVGSMPRFNDIGGLYGAESEIKAMLKNSELKGLIKSNLRVFFVNCIVGRDLLDKAGGSLPKFDVSSTGEVDYELESQKLQDSYKTLLMTRFYEDETKVALVNNIIVGDIFGRCVSAGSYDHSDDKNDYFNKSELTESEVSNLVRLLDARVVEHFATAK